MGGIIMRGHIGVRGAGKVEKYTIEAQLSLWLVTPIFRIFFIDDTHEHLNDTVVSLSTFL